MNRKVGLLLATLVLLAPVGDAALSPTISYQGRLADGGVTPTGMYDLQFRLYDASSGGTLLGTHVAQDVSVTAGLFNVQINFGDPPPLDGNDRWLEIGVRPFNSTGAFTTVTPRQQLTPSPFAFYAPSAGTATSATGFSGALSGEVSGPQSATVVTNAVPANTPNAVVRRDASGDFVAGTLSLAGNLNLEHTTSAAVGVVTKGGSLFLHDYGADNTFLGQSAGNTFPVSTGSQNVGVGRSALGGIISGG